MFVSNSKNKFYLVFPLILAGVLGSCASNNTTATSGNNSTGNKTSSLSGSISIDGSSTVFPLTEIMSEEFQNSYPDVRIAIGVSGTGGGFKKFCAGETDISNASRPIKPSEAEECAKNSINFIEIPVAFDALSVVVHKDNDWAYCLTAAELKKVWSPGAQGKITNWNQVRDNFPDQPLSLYAPGTDSGTFDYFTEAINGDGGVARGDVTSTEDDNVIVQGVSGDLGSLGYFGLAYLEENVDKIHGVNIDNEDPNDGGDGCVEPTVANVEQGLYQPLARPLFIYVSESALARAEVQAFANYYADEANGDLVAESGYITFPSPVYTKVKERLETKKMGSAFLEISTVGVNLQDVL
ncbi:MAG: PstS family phosphate ABC transporter substrate-binding protein [Cyanobacterium sp. T60_A2020_053]|nr:PstS family phosphate ABC transporter substrate-binding protein [Cyanobacterium sp. T60_A2020_053]